MKRMFIVAAATTAVAIGALGLSGPMTAAAGETAKVEVVHGINGTSAGARLFGDPLALPRSLPVTVNIADGAIVLEDFTFGETASAEVPAGTYNVKVFVGDLLVIDQDLTLSAGDDVTATAKLLGKTPLIVVEPAD